MEQSREILAGLIEQDIGIELEPEWVWRTLDKAGVNLADYGTIDRFMTQAEMAIRRAVVKERLAKPEELIGLMIGNVGLELEQEWVEGVLEKAGITWEKYKDNGPRLFVRAGTRAIWAAVDEAGIDRPKKEAEPLPTLTWQEAAPYWELMKGILKRLHTDYIGPDRRAYKQACTFCAKELLPEGFRCELGVQWRKRPGWPHACMDRALDMEIATAILRLQYIGWMPTSRSPAGIATAVRERKLEERLGKMTTRCMELREELRQVLTDVVENWPEGVERVGGRKQGGATRRLRGLDYRFGLMELEEMQKKQMKKQRITWPFEWGEEDLEAIIERDKKRQKEGTDDSFVRTY